MWHKWCLLHIKGKLKSPAFYAVVVMLVLLYMLVSKAMDAAMNSKTVLLCAGDSVVGRELTDELLKVNDAEFFFEETDAASIEQRVRAGDAEIGLIFTKRLDAALIFLNDEPLDFVNKRLDESIIMYVNSASVEAFGVKQYLYSYILGKRAPRLLAEYINERAPSADLDVLKNMLKMQDEVRRRMDIEIYDIRTIDVPLLNKRDNNGVVWAMAVFLPLLILALFYYAEEKTENSGFYRAVSGNKRIVFMLSSIAISVMLTVLLTYICIIFMRIL